MIGRHLGIRVEAPVSVRLPSGQEVIFDVLLPDFGGERGMLLVTDHSLIRPVEAQIVEAGFGYSTLSVPSAEAEADPDLETAREVLRDWQWTGKPGEAPAWMAPD